MIDRTNSRGDRLIRLVCDECETEATDWWESDEFSYLMNDAKDGGWLIRNEDGHWTHVCPHCVG